MTIGGSTRWWRRRNGELWRWGFAEGVQWCVLGVEFNFDDGRGQYFHFDASAAFLRFFLCRGISNRFLLLVGWAEVACLSQGVTYGDQQGVPSCIQGSSALTSRSPALIPSGLPNDALAPVHGC